MAATVHGVWAIDIGSNSLKALSLRQGDEGPEVVGFDYVESQVPVLMFFRMNHFGGTTLCLEWIMLLLVHIWPIIRERPGSDSSVIPWRE